MSSIVLSLGPDPPSKDRARRAIIRPLIDTARLLLRARRAQAAASDTTSSSGAIVTLVLARRALRLRSADGVTTRS